MGKNEIDYLYLIVRYLKSLEKCNEITKYIYNHPELLEKKYMYEYPHEEFRFWSGKLGRYAKEYNKLYELLSNEQKEQINKIKLLEE